MPSETKNINRKDYDEKKLLANYYQKTAAMHTFSSLSNEVDRVFDEINLFLLQRKSIPSDFSVYINKALIFAIITNEISREKGTNSDEIASNSIRRFKKFMEAGGNLMAIPSKDSFFSIGPFQFTKKTYEKIANKYDLIASDFSKSTLQDHISAFYFLTTDNLKIFNRFFFSKSKKLQAAFEKADEKDRARFIVALIGAMHNAGYDNILKVLGEGLGDVPKYKVKRYPDRKSHPNGYWDVKLEDINDKTLANITSRMIEHSYLPKVGKVMGPYLKVLVELYSLYSEEFRNNNSFVSLTIKKVKR